MLEAASRTKSADPLHIGHRRKVQDRKITHYAGIKAQLRWVDAKPGRCPVRFLMSVQEMVLGHKIGFQYPGVFDHEVVAGQSLAVQTGGKAVEIRVGRIVEPLEPVKPPENGVSFV